jgi:hypothetical protein
MNKTRFTSMTLAAALLLSSCSSSYQAQGGVTGAMIGSHVGGAVGLLAGHGHGHFRGSSSALGSLIGMGVGAVLGVGIASQIEEKERHEARRYDEPAVNQRETPTRTGSTGNTSAGLTSVSISELSYMDADGDGYISRDETIEVESFITNTTKTTLHDIVISMHVSDPKAFSTSPSLTTTLYPGQKIRYTGRVHCERTRGNRSVGINISVEHAGRMSESSSMYVGVK